MVTYVLRRLLAAAGLALLVAPGQGGGAAAAEPLGAAILGWVYAIDASPSWTARITGLSVDDNRNAATIERLEVAAEAGGIALTVQGVVIEEYAEQPDGGFTAKSLRVAEARITTKSTDVVLTDVELADVGVPALAGVVYDKSKPFTSLVAAYSAMVKSRVSGGRAAELALVERIEGVASRISYANVSIGRLAGGKIETLSAGPLKQESPSPNPLVELSIARAEGSAVDLDAFLHVYDPLRYVAGTGDRTWRNAIGRGEYTDITMTAPGIRLKLDAVSLKDFRVRQPAESFAPLIDAITVDRNVPPALMDALNSRYLSGLLSSYGVGRFAMQGVDLTAAGIDQISFNRLSLTDASSDRIGEIAIEGFVGAVRGQGAVAVGRFAVGDFVPPPIYRLVTAFEGIQRGADIDVSAIAPKLGSIEAADIEVQAIDFPGASLGEMRADFDNYVGSMPTSVVVEIDDLDIATSSLRPARASGLIAGLGYDRIVADSSFELSWRESDETLNLDDFRLAIEDFGNATANVVLAGLTREVIERSDGAADILADLFFDRASLTFEDKSVVERSLSMRAEILKIPLERLKQQLAGALPLMLAFVGNPDKVRAIVPVLQAFIRSPGTLTIEAAPEPPVPVTAIGDAARTRPQSLPDMLGITVTGMPGQEDAGPPEEATPLDDDSPGTDEPAGPPGPTPTPP